VRARPDSAATCRPCFTPAYGRREIVAVDLCLDVGPTAHSVARARRPGGTCDRPRAQAGNAPSHNRAATRAHACRRPAGPAAPYNGPHDLVRAVLASLTLFASRTRRFPGEIEQSQAAATHHCRRHCCSISGRSRSRSSPPTRPLSPSNTSRPSSPCALAAIAGALNPGGRRLCAPPWAACRRKNQPVFATRGSR
jgi:hypothetical protein